MSQEVIDNMGADESCCASDEDVSAIVSLGVLDSKSHTYEGLCVDIFNRYA